MAFALRSCHRFAAESSISKNSVPYFKPFQVGFFGYWLLITLTLFTCGPVYAEWVSIGKTDYGMTVYVDPHTIRRNGDLAKLWVLSDYKSIQYVEGGEPFLSLKYQREIHCPEERIRFLVRLVFSGNMGGGKTL